MEKSWQEKVWRFDQLRMLECYSNGIEVVPGTYKKGRGQAENDKSRIPERESQWSCRSKDRCQFAG